MQIGYPRLVIASWLAAGLVWVGTAAAQQRAPVLSDLPLTPPANSPRSPGASPAAPVPEPVEIVPPDQHEQDLPLSQPEDTRSVIKLLPPVEELSPTPTPPAQSAPYVPSDALQAWLTQFVLARIPHEFEDKRKWGMTTHVWDGLHVSHDGLQVKTKRRRKEVNDGTWRMYRAELLNPAEEFHVRLENLHDAGKTRAGFDLVVSARVHAFGRMTKYVKGVQLASLSANADATVQLRLRCRLGLRLDGARLPPDVILIPEVTDADLTLVRFHLQDVSDVGGTLAKELGRGVKNMLEEKIHDERRKLPERINRELDKQRDKLRISLADLTSSKWSELSKFVARGK